MKNENSSIIKKIYVEGNVGVGKTTFLRFIKEHIPDIQIAYEPYHLWQHVGGQDLLGLFFKDEKRWSFALQLYILMTRRAQEAISDQHNRGRIEILERSEYSGRYCFVLNLYNMGLLSGAEFEIYNKFFDCYIKGDLPVPSGFIYLRTSAEICYERIKHRSRVEENPITLDYLKGLEKLHDDWFLHKKIADSDLKEVPVLVLDNTQNLLESSKQQEEYIQKVNMFLEAIKQP